MSDMAVSQVLAQIRAIAAQTSGIKPPGAAGAAGGPAALGGVQPGSFGNLLKQGIDSVNRSQQAADVSADAYERGVPGVDLARVMIDTQKASVQFRALAETRNRLVSVYQDIMNMPI